MKKNFMAIASLLIAAMLLVVSCAPEANVEGKVEDGLVEAVIGLGRSAKDISITSNNANATITYKYKMTPAWSSDNTGAPIYGKVDTFTDIPADSNGKQNGTYKMDDTVSSVFLGKVTPGLWNIEVEGYCKVDNLEKLVLKGKTSAYFNGATNSKATVFVAPVSTDETVSVTIKLKMQDLENSTTATYDKIGYAFTDLSGTSSIVEDPATTHEIGVASNKDHVNTYTTTIVNVKSGFNTVTFSLPGYSNGKGGITKTFLAIPGVPVTIEGSVTPAEFKEGKADIVVLNMESGSISVKKSSDNSTPTPTRETYNNGKENEKTVNIYTLDSGVEYTFTYVSGNDTSSINSVIADGYNPTRAYKWYVGGAKYSEELNDGETYTFKESNPGDYNVTCIETITFTKGEGDDKVEHKLQASTTFEVVRVL